MSFASLLIRRGRAALLGLSAGALAALGPTTSPARQASAAGPVGRWCVHAGAPLGVAPVVDSAGRVTLGTADGYVHSFERGGRYRWSRTLTGAVTGLAVRADGGQLWIGTLDRRVLSLSASGTVHWSMDTTARPLTALLQRAEGGLLLFGGSDRHLHAVSPRGGVLWRAPLGALPSADPAPDRGNVAWVPVGRAVLRLEGAWRHQSFSLPDEVLSAPLVLPSGVAVLAGSELVVLGDDGERRWSQRGVAAVGRVEPSPGNPGGALVLVSEVGGVSWRTLDGAPLAAAGPTAAGPSIGGPVASLRLDGETAYVLLRRGELIAVRPKEGVVGRRQVAAGPLRELSLDTAGRRAVVSDPGGRVCSVPLADPPEETRAPVDGPR